MGEGDQIDIRGVEHDLDGHQYDDEISADQDSEEAGGEEDGAHGDIRGERNHDSRLPSSIFGVLASTIAPTMAPVKKTPMISKGRRYSLNILMPTAEVLPSWRIAAAVASPLAPLIGDRTTKASRYRVPRTA